MKSIVVVIALAGALAGCASPSAVRQKTPAVDVSSAQPAKKVAGCIADQWEEGNHKPPMTSRPTTNGYALMGEADLGLYGKDTAFIIDIDDTPAGSRTVFYSNIALERGLELVGGIVRDCQK